MFGFLMEWAVVTAVFLILHQKKDLVNIIHHPSFTYVIFQYEKQQLMIQKQITKPYNKFTRFCTSFNLFQRNGCLFTFAP